MQVYEDMDVSEETQISVSEMSVGGAVEISVTQVEETDSEDYWSMLGRIPDPVYVGVKRKEGASPQTDFDYE